MSQAQLNQDVQLSTHSSSEPDPRRWRILFVLLAAIFLTLMSVSVVNVALPSIQNGLGASHSDIQWVLSGYALIFGVVLVSAGRAGDLLGRGGFFIFGAEFVSFASVASGVVLGSGWIFVTKCMFGMSC